MSALRSVQVLKLFMDRAGIHDWHYMLHAEFDLVHPPEKNTVAISAQTQGYNLKPGDLLSIQNQYQPPSR